MKLSEDLKRSLRFGFTMASFPIYRSLLVVSKSRGMSVILLGVAIPVILVASSSGVKLGSSPSNKHRAPVSGSESYRRI